MWLWALTGRLCHPFAAHRQCAGMLGFPISYFVSCPVSQQRPTKPCCRLQHLRHPPSASTTTTTLSVRTADRAAEQRSPEKSQRSQTRSKNQRGGTRGHKTGKHPKKRKNLVCSFSVGQSRRRHACGPLLSCRLYRTRPPAIPHPSWADTVLAVFHPWLCFAFHPQLPGAVQGGYLPPVCGMESLFSYGPTMPQTLAGLSRGTLLQQYQQYQQNLQDPCRSSRSNSRSSSRKPCRPRPSKAESRAAAANPSDASETKGDKSPATESTKEEPQLESKVQTFQTHLRCSIQLLMSLYAESAR